MRLPRPRTDCQRTAAIRLVNAVFAALVAALLAGSFPLATDAAPTASITLAAAAAR
jgi:hypothetical protein